MAKKLSELKPTDEVVVTLGAKTESQNGKTVTIEAKRDVVMPMAGYQAIQVDEDGHSPTLGRTVKLKGTPKYNAGETESMAGTHKEFAGVEALTDDKKKGKAADPADGKILMPKGDKTGNDEDELGEENEGDEAGNAGGEGK